MVNPGHPSRGCGLCRRRKVKCDETKPTCQRCQKYGKPCPGYEEGTAVKSAASHAPKLQLVWGHSPPPIQTVSKNTTSRRTSAAPRFPQDFLSASDEPEAPKGVKMPDIGQASHDAKPPELTLAPERPLEPETSKPSSVPRSLYGPEPEGLNLKSNSESSPQCEVLKLKIRLKPLRRFERLKPRSISEPPPRFEDLT